MFDVMQRLGELPLLGIELDGTAQCGPDSLPVSVLPQDWQEIVALYEKDNSYLGRVTSSGHPGDRTLLGKPTPTVLRH